MNNCAHPQCQLHEFVIYIDYVTIVPRCQMFLNAADHDLTVALDSAVMKRGLDQLSLMFPILAVTDQQAIAQKVGNRAAQRSRLPHDAGLPHEHIMEQFGVVEQINVIGAEPHVRQIAISLRKILQRLDGITSYLLDCLEAG